MYKNTHNTAEETQEAVLKCIVAGMEARPHYQSTVHTSPFHFRFVARRTDTSLAPKESCSSVVVVIKLPQKKTPPLY